MIIAAAIREAETEYVVYFLLEAYLETASRRDAFKDLPPLITMLPLTNRRDARSRFALLMEELNAASKRLHHAACPAIREALSVFSVALQRLEALEGNRMSTRRGDVSDAAAGQDTPPHCYLPALSGSKASTEA